MHILPSRFQVAVHTLVVIATSDRACASGTIARDVEAHAVFLRRLLAQLARVGIVTAREGRSGGYRLARSPEEITLAQVFQAVQAVDSSEEVEPPRCRELPIYAVLEALDAEVEERLLAGLALHTLASVIESKRQTELVSSTVS